MLFVVHGMHIFALLKCNLKVYKIIFLSTMVMLNANIYNIINSLNIFLRVLFCSQSHYIHSRVCFLCNIDLEEIRLQSKGDKYFFEKHKWNIIVQACCWIQRLLFNIGFSNCYKWKHHTKVNNVRSYPYHCNKICGHSITSIHSFLLCFIPIVT